MARKRKRNPGISGTNLLLLAGLGIGAYLLLKKSGVLKGYDDAFAMGEDLEGFDSPFSMGEDLEGFDSAFSMGEFPPQPGLLWTPSDAEVADMRARGLLPSPGNPYGLETRTWLDWEIAYNAIFTQPKTIVFPPPGGTGGGGGGVITPPPPPSQDVTPPPTTLTLEQVMAMGKNCLKSLKSKGCWKLNIFGEPTNKCCPSVDWSQVAHLVRFPKPVAKQKKVVARQRRRW